MNFDLLSTCNQKSVCIKPPQATQALASHADVKGILKGFVTFVKHSFRIPLRTSACEATQALVCK